MLSSPPPPLRRTGLAEAGSANKTMFNKSVFVRSNGAFEVLKDLHDIDPGVRLACDPEVQSAMLNPGEFMPIIPRVGDGVVLRTISVSF